MISEVDLASEKWVDDVANIVIRRELNDLYVSMLQQHVISVFCAYVHWYGPLCVN